MLWAWSHPARARATQPPAGLLPNLDSACLLFSLQSSTGDSARMRVSAHRTVFGTSSRALGAGAPSSSSSLSCLRLLTSLRAVDLDCSPRDPRSSCNRPPSHTAPGSAHRVLIRAPKKEQVPGSTQNCSWNCQYEMFKEISL